MHWPAWQFTCCVYEARGYARKVDTSCRSRLLLATSTGDPIEAAEAAGDQATAQACRSILKEEVAMAEWLKEHLPEITRAFLARSADPDAEAKR